MAIYPDARVFILYLSLFVPLVCFSSFLLCSVEWSAFSSECFKNTSFTYQNRQTISVQNYYNVYSIRWLRFLVITCLLHTLANSQFECSKLFWFCFCFCFIVEFQSSQQQQQQHDRVRQNGCVPKLIPFWNARLFLVGRFFLLLSVEGNSYFQLLLCKEISACP